MWCGWHSGVILEELVVNTHLLITGVQGVETEIGKVITGHVVRLAGFGGTRSQHPSPHYWGTRGTNCNRKGDYRVCGVAGMVAWFWRNS